MASLLRSQDKRRSQQAKMTLKIEKDSDGHQTTIRLIGRMQAEHLKELKAQMQDSGPGIVLDLDEVTLVDVEVVRFLGLCEAEGGTVLHGAPYIREWMRRERDRKG
jgi:hypothetical protein